MKSDQAEYDAVSLLAKRDKRYRIITYTLLGLVFAYMLISLNILTNEVRRSNQKLVENAKKLVHDADAASTKRYEDSKVVARETIRYTTCIFLLSVDARTEEAQERCFNAADLPGGLDRQDFSTLKREQLDATAPVSATVAPVSRVQRSEDGGGIQSESSINSTPFQWASQVNTSQAEPTQPPGSTQQPRTARTPNSITTFLQNVLNITQGVL